MIAALYVERGGPYFGRSNVDPWDKERDARLYAGPWPVVAHPPCARWCRLARLVASRGGRSVGDDDGCFASALASVRTWGGVLEHPAESLAWPAFNIPRPTRGGWTLDINGGWTCVVDQAAYGHVAPKATWLYAFGLTPPSARWNRGQPTMVVTTSRQTRGSKREMPKKQRALTPPAFADWLIKLAHIAGERRAA